MCRLLPTPAVLLVLASLAAADSHIFDVTREGQTAESNGFSITGGFTYARKRFPAVTLGTVKPPDGKRALTYVVLSKSAGNRLTIPSVSCDLNVTGSEATEKSSIEMGGKKVSLAYTARIDRGVIASEDLTVNGKKVDLRGGRVLLVDFSKDATWTQVKAALPEASGDSGKPEPLQDLVMKLVQQLREDPAVRDFLK